MNANTRFTLNCLLETHEQAARVFGYPRMFHGNMTVVPIHANHMWKAASVTCSKMGANKHYFVEIMLPRRDKFCWSDKAWNAYEARDKAWRAYMAKQKQH